MKRPSEDQATYLKDIAAKANINPYGNHRENGNNLRTLLGQQTNNKLAAALLAEPEYANDETLGELLSILSPKIINDNAGADKDFRIFF